MVYHWCTKDHWSGGEKHNGMYCPHTTEDHDAWRAEHESKKTHRITNPSAAPSPVTSSTNADGAQKKLALAETLRAALCTQAGLSPDVADRIWSEACRDSGND